MELEVWLGPDLVGRLVHEGQTNRFAFEYDVAWSARPDAFPLAPEMSGARLAATTPDAHSAAVRQFFENLLPEGQALDDAAAAYKVSKSNLTGLLAVLGRETAGALRLRVAGAAPEVESKRPMSPAELSARIRQRPHLPFSVWDGKVRLSIAGYQDKLAVLETDGEWFLVEGPHLASTHLLKPEPVNPAMAGLTSNEFFCMRLAKAIGLAVAEVRLIHVPEPVLAITRFDRSLQPGEPTAVHRTHTIDGCQLLGLPSGFKYERPYGDSKDVKHIRDGASLPRLFHTLDTSATPAAQQQQLLRWTLFQVLIGNTDAHAKNLSFFMGPGGPVLAPAYDMVCGKVFSGEHIDMTYALAIGDAFTAEELSPYEWALLCTEARLNPALLQKEMVRMANTTLSCLAEVASESVEEGADPQVVSGIVNIVEGECRRHLELAPDIKGMMAIAKPR